MYKVSYVSLEMGILPSWHLTTFHDPHPRIESNKKPTDLDNNWGDRTISIFHLVIMEKWTLAHKSGFDSLLQNVLVLPKRWTDGWMDAWLNHIVDLKGPKNIVPRLVAPPSCAAHRSPVLLVSPPHYTRPCPISRSVSGQSALQVCSHLPLKQDFLENK